MSQHTAWLIGSKKATLQFAKSGIANVACPAGELRERARAAAEAVAARPASAVTITKALMRDPAALAARMEVEGVHFAAQLKSADAREAFAAFAGKRAPRQSPS